MSSCESRPSTLKSESRGRAGALTFPTRRYQSRPISSHRAGEIDTRLKRPVSHPAAPRSATARNQLPYRPTGRAICDFLGTRPGVRGARRVTHIRRGAWCANRFWWPVGRFGGAGGLRAHFSRVGGGIAEMRNIDRSTDRSPAHGVGSGAPNAPPRAPNRAKHTPPTHAPTAPVSM